MTAIKNAAGLLNVYKEDLLAGNPNPPLLQLSQAYATIAIAEQLKILANAVDNVVEELQKSNYHLDNIYRYGTGVEVNHG